MKGIKVSVNSRMSGALFALVLMICLIPAAWAQDTAELQFNMFRLSSEASVEVDNDLMTAILRVHGEDKDPALLADKINKTTSWAIEKLRPFTTITSKTRDYQTYPRYDTSQSRRLIGWRATQTIELESEDLEAAGKAIQLLQEKLQVQTIQLSATPATREKASDLLITKALNSFKDRARLIQKNMNSAGFRIVDVDIQAGQGNFAMFNNRAMMEDMSASSRVQREPAIEAGTTLVTVQVSGRIQLQ